MIKDIGLLRKIIRNLEKENKLLKKLLKENNISFNVSNIEEEKLEDNINYDLDQGGRIIDRYISDDMAKHYCGMFWGRIDVYAKRGRKGGYFPQCKNRWNDLCPIQTGKTKSCIKDCPNKEWSKLDLSIIKNHLYGYKEDGSDVIGIYPLLQDNTCRFIVFDFDNHESDDLENKDWIKEVNIVRNICKENNIKALVERSRSGKGAHIWIFFNKPIKASIARTFGYLLLEKGSRSTDITSFEYFDRLYPNQDTSDNLGNLIALPLQHKALLNGNSAFVDENFNAYEDQWNELFNNTKKYSIEEINEYIRIWQSELSMDEDNISFGYINERIKPWRKNYKFDKDNVIGELDITLSNGIYIDELNVMPRLLYQIRSLATFDNPVYYKNRNLGLSNYNTSSYVSLAKEENNYINIPRGLKDKLIEKLEEANIEYRINDERISGKHINASFNGELRDEQSLAAKDILTYDEGILEAATAFGKTVVSSYLITNRKISTLVLIQNKSLLKQWIEELNKFLIINEELPEYKTKQGRVKTRKNIVGELSGSKDTLTGIVDVAMIQTLANKDNKNEILDNYGMVIFDECHHAASSTAIDVLKEIKAKYVYGVSATPNRSDRLEKINYMLLGPIRHTFSAIDKNRIMKIKHYVYPRYTRVIDNYSSKENINTAYSLIATNDVRNEMIINDVIKCIELNRTPLVLTREKEHAKYLYDRLKEEIDNVYIIYGDNKEKENEEIRSKLRNVGDDTKYVLIATGSKVGEGFDLPRLDTLMLAAPVSYEGRVKQYLGRLNREYKNKEDVILYDYIDMHMKLFNNMHFKRLKTYKKVGFLIRNDISNKQDVESIYDMNNYLEVFNRDLQESNSKIVISSPELIESKVNTFIGVVKDSQERGIDIKVITTSVDDISIGSVDSVMNSLMLLRNIGIEVIENDDINECYAVIDDELIWYGRMNLLGKDDIHDSMIRFIDKEIASELMNKR